MLRGRSRTGFGGRGKADSSEKFGEENNRRGEKFMGTEKALTRLAASAVEEAAANGRPDEAAKVESAAKQPRPAPAVVAGDSDGSTLALSDSCSGRWVIAGDGHVLGTFTGEIECAGELLIGRSAEVNADIRGSEVVIAGTVRGNIVARSRLRITPTGRLEGDAHAGALIVEEGGVHHGVIRVHPEGVPDDAETHESAPKAESAVVSATPVDRVKRFWGEFF
jgi:cytoskeletal protein CcmA (bactofilin family)